MELPFMRNNMSSQQKIPLIVLLIALTLVVVSIVPLRYPLARVPSPPEAVDSYRPEEIIKIPEEDKCDIFTGEWIPNPNAPYYTNTTCWAIHDHTNCLKYGRPDTGFMNWRWKPDGCDLPIFNPYQFLEIARGKSMAFVGDNLGRNQMQSLICLLSRVEYPIDVSYTQDDDFKRWKYLSYNFTLAFFSSPFLVKMDKKADNGLFNLYLDEFDEKWTSHIHEFDFLIINGGPWFFRPSMYYENQKVVGCRFCQYWGKITDLPATYGYRRAFRTAFRAINSLKKFGGVTFFATFAPSHFENGEWNNGGNCIRKKPLGSNEINLEGEDLELYMTQVEEFRTAERVGKRKGYRFRLLDTTQAMLLRPDGHPSSYGHPRQENATSNNDCANWCLPGPIDSWSDFLLQMLKLEGKRSHEEKLQLQKATENVR